MPLFYFGYNPVTIFIISLLIASFAVYFYLKRLNSHTAYTKHTLPMLACVALVSGLFYVANDLTKNISISKAQQLEQYYQTSTEYIRNGAKFREAMSDLAEKNNILVSAKQSYVGTEIYTTALFSQRK